MAMLPGVDFAQDLGTWGTAVLVVVAVVLLAPKARKAARDRRARNDEQLRDAMRQIAETTATHAVQELTDRLFAPNGGKSLYDISQRVELVRDEIKEVRGELGVVGNTVEMNDKRTERLERQVFEVMTPEQADIAAILHVDRRSDDQPGDD